VKDLGAQLSWTTVFVVEYVRAFQSFPIHISCAGPDWPSYHSSSILLFPKSILRQGSCPQSASKVRHIEIGIRALTDILPKICLCDGDAPFLEARARDTLVRTIGCPNLRLLTSSSVHRFSKGTMPWHFIIRKYVYLFSQWPQW